MQNINYIREISTNKKKGNFMKNKKNQKQHSTNKKKGNLMKNKRNQKEHLISFDVRRKRSVISMLEN